MKEKNIQTIFGKINKEYGYFELKIEKTNSMLFSRVAEHQVTALLNTQIDGLYHKIADQTFGRAGAFGHTLKKPFDCFKALPMKGYVVVCWYIPRKEKRFDYILIDDFINESKVSTRKSLTKARSLEIAEKSIIV